MLLNPLINLILAVISLGAGTAALVDTNDWMVMLPCAIFMVLFFVSLFRPVAKRDLELSSRVVRKPRRPIVKLTGTKLRILSASRTPFTADLRSSAPDDLSRTSA